MSIENIAITNAELRIDTAVESFDMREIQNRRFMFNPLTGTLILGRQYSGNQLVASHAEEHGRMAEGEPFDNFIRGWIGTGGRFPDGVIHFAPPIPKDNPAMFDKGFDTFEMFARNGATAETVIRGFPGAWEQPLSGLLDGEKLNETRKEVMKPMADTKNTYESSSYGDKLEPADRLKLEHHVYMSDEKTDISRLTVLPMERLQALRAESAAAEQAIFESLRGQADLWEDQAAVTLLIDKAIEYNKVPAVAHSSNQWVRDNANSDRQSMSNMVYKMAYHVNEKTSYDRAAGKTVPVGYELTWDVYTNSPNLPGYRRNVQKIAGQDRKPFTSKADMDKYFAGRIKAYAHLFTEISPPIPPEYKKCFSVNGQLLPGYTAQGEKPTDRAAAIGGDSVVDQKLTELLKEREDMNEPLNIKMATSEMHDSGSGEGAWLKLPATAEQLQAALARIGAAGGELGKDYVISGFESPIYAVASLDLGTVQKASIDELNFLAAGLEKMEPIQLEKLNAASEAMADLEDVRRLAEYPQNTDFYVHMPDIKDYKQLGAYYLHDSEMVNMPEAWKSAVDVEKLGMIAVEKERGAFTERGYLIESGDKWQPVPEIPQEYRITPKAERTEPERKAEVKSDPRETQPDPNINSEALAAVLPTPAAVMKAAPIVFVSENPRDRMKEITDKLEQGIKGIFDSEKYKVFLDTMSKFHNYSLNNCLLIAFQNPAASRVAGFTSWKVDFKRDVKKGEKGIKILAPAPFKTTKTVDAVGADGKPLFDSNGRRVKEEKEITVPAFKITSVFDVSQTEGEPLPTLGVNELSGRVDRYKDFFAALEKTSPVPVAFEQIATGSKGYHHMTENRIAINEGMSELQTIKTLIHEISHARLHAIDANLPLKDQNLPDRRTREVQAESIAYAVCQHYGLDTSEYSLGYVTAWSGGKQLDVLKASLETIRKEADAIITEIDKNFAELTREQEMTAQQTAPERVDTFTIYQLKDGDQTRDLRFELLDKLREASDAANYINVYAAPLASDMTLEKLFFTFNMNRPEDFTGHSLSVSDVVVLNRNGKETAYYVDRGDFKELPGFLTLKEQAAELKGNALWQEYTALTERYPDSIVFKQVGDFYEVMGDKANVVVNELGGNYHVSGRDVSLTERVPLLGVPAHNFDTLVREIVDKGFKVVVAEKDDIKMLSKPEPSVDLKIVADYMQKQFDAVQAADPNKTQGEAVFSMTIKRLEQANEKIPGDHPQLKALITHAAQSTDLPMLKERMNTLYSEFIQKYSPTVQMMIDTSGKAEQTAPKAPAAPVRQNEPAPAQKPPAHGENVAAIEAKVKAGEVINLADLSDAMKKDRAAQATQTAQQPSRTATSRNTPQPPAKTGAQPYTENRAYGQPALVNAEQPSIRDKIASGRQELATQKPATARAAVKTQNAAIGG